MLRLRSLARGLWFLPMLACGLVDPEPPSATPADAGSDTSVIPPPPHHRPDAGDSSTDARVPVEADAAGGDADATIPPAPRPVAPLSTSRATSRTPTFRWELPPGVTDATLDLCVDRACTHPIGEPVHVTGTRYAPTSALPVGVVYWRLHPKTLTQVTSPTWQVTVGAVSAPVDTSWGTTLDVNGDGYADVVAGAYNAPDSDGGNVGAGLAFVYLGSATGLGSTPAVMLSSPENSPDNGVNFGWSVAGAGDVNGDGYADLVVGTLNGPGRAYVYFGGPTGVGATPSVTLSAPGSGTVFGGAVASAGDVNGDGYADIVVGAAPGGSDPGYAYIYLGSAAGTLTTPAVTLPDPSPSIYDYFASVVAGVGDVNGDGFGDVMVAAPWNGSAEIGGSVPGVAYLYLGGPSGVGTTPITFEPPGGASLNLGVGLAGAGDVNGDGYADIIMGTASSPGEALIYMGSAAGPPLTPTFTLEGAAASNIAGVGFGQSVASAGDVNADGYADVIVGSSEGSGAGPTNAFVYLGSPTGLAATPTSVLAVLDYDLTVSSAGDVNGDGFADVIIGGFVEYWQSGAPDAGTPMFYGSASVFLGSASGSVVAPAVTLSDPAAPINAFGFSVFGATN